MENTEDQQVIKSVCGGILTEPEKYPSAVYNGERLYFCARACLRVFEENPRAFLDGDVEHPLEEDA